MNKRLLTTTLIATLGSAVFMAPNLVTADTQAAIDYRTSVMTIYKWHLGPMGGMMKNKIPYDAATFRAKAEGLAHATSLDLLSGFPRGSTSDDSSAKSEIWQNWSTFEERYRDLQQQSAKLASVAAGGDMNAIKQQFGATAKTCKGCHKDFKEK